VRAHYHDWIEVSELLKPYRSFLCANCSVLRNCDRALDPRVILQAWPSCPSKNPEPLV
jgi:hypothetical protein